MTARVMTLKGGGAGRYYTEHLPNYYLEVGEPAGEWHGRGAAALGLVGAVDSEDFLALMSGVDPQSGSLLGGRFGEESVRGFDVTASAPKSVSVLFALGDDHIRQTVTAAHDGAVAAMVDWVDAHAHTRFRIDGEIAVVDAEGIMAATFRQHTSRALDPQLHTHVVIANRVLSPDGRWLALDARTIKYDQRTLSAIYHAHLRNNLTRDLGVRWLEPANGIAEIADMPRQLLTEFSARTADISRSADIKIDRFTDTMGREPDQRERWKLEREAVLDSRPPKTTSPSPTQLREHWASQTHAIGHTPTTVITNAIGRVEPTPELDGLTTRRIAHQALETLSEKQSTWLPAELTRELAAATPTGLGAPSHELSRHLEAATGHLVEHGCVELRPRTSTPDPLRRDGRPLTEAATDRALTTNTILTEEHHIDTWATRVSAAPKTHNPPLPPTPTPLTIPQYQLASAAAGHAPLVLAIGPAGTGKTTALQPAIASLNQQHRPVLGLAPSASAARVLGEETGVRADTIDKLLAEHSLDRAPRTDYDLPAGTTLIIDEAATIPNPQTGRARDPRPTTSLAHGPHR